jgi:hypothetical protein
VTTVTSTNPVEEHLRFVVEGMSRLGGMPQNELMYGSYYEAILKLGRPFTGQPRPTGMRKRPNKMCYRNATLAALHYGWDYVEGVAVSGDLGLPVQHAWNMDDDGNAVDLTWKHPEKASYFGIVIPRAMMCALTAHHRRYGLLDQDWELGNPLLRYGTLVPPEGLPRKEK